MNGNELLGLIGRDVALIGRCLQYIRVFAVHSDGICFFKLLK